MNHLLAEFNTEPSLHLPAAVPQLKKGIEMAQLTSRQRIINSASRLAALCACIGLWGCGLIALGIASAMMPVSVAQANNGQCKWEGGAGAPTYPNCKPEDCVDKGGLASCDPAIEYPSQPSPPVDAKSFQYLLGVTNDADTAYQCIAAGGVWGGYCGNPPCTVSWYQYAGTDTAATSLADATVAAKYPNAWTLTSDTGWDVVNGPYGPTYVDNGSIQVQSERDRYYSTPQGSFRVAITKSRTASCPPGDFTRTNSQGFWDCFRAVADSCVKCGNPVSPANGEKFETAVDFDPKAIGGLEVRRYYRSMGYSRPLGSAADVYGPNDVWRWSYQRTLYPVGGNSYVSAVVLREDGAPIYFDTSGKEMLNREGAADRLVSSGSGWTLTRANSDVESYNASGQLTSIRARAGTTIHLTYGTSTITITDDFGHSIVYSLNAFGFIATATLPDAQHITYGYNSGNYLTSVTYADNSVKTYVYEDPKPWLLSGIIDETNTRYSTYLYTNGAVASESHAGNVDNWSYSYGITNPSGGYALIYEPSGNRRQYNYSNANGLLKLSGQFNCAGCGLPSSESFDANGNPASRYDDNHNQTTYVFDLTRNLETSRTEAAGTARARTIGTQWDPTWRQPSLITEADRTTAYTYDATGNTLTRKVTDTTVAPNVSRTWTYTYDSYGRMLTATGPRTDVTDLTTYTYYTCTSGIECGQVKTVTDAIGNVTTYNTYNGDGLPLTITDPNGVVNTLTYDGRQRPTSRQVGSETTGYSYWPTGLLKQVTLPDSSYLLYTYDAAQRLTQINDGAGNKIVYTLDSAGHRTGLQSYDPSNVLHLTHSWAYNAQNELYQDINAAGTAAVTTTFGYDGNANQTSVAAPLSRSTGTTYDELNRLKQITDPATGITQFGYDVHDNATTVTDPRSQVTNYTYTGFGELRTQVSPDTGTMTNTYDLNGNLFTSTDARGALATYSYDALNRVSHVAYSLGGVTDQTVTFTYDVGTNGKGRLTGTSDANHSMSFAYDTLGRVSSKSQTVGSVTLQTGYSYTNANLTNMTLPSGHVVSYGYNANHQVTSVTVNGTAIVNNITYEPLGAVNGWNWGNGTTSTRTYDGDGRISLVNNSSATKNYTYDDGSRITGISDAGNASLTWTYGYDALDRLNSASTTAQTQSFTYDANGNRLTQGGTSASTFTVASASNRLTSTSGGLTRTYAYDAGGHATGYGGLTFTYNDAGRLILATTPSVTVQSDYNSLGQRIRKRAGGATTLFAYDETGHLVGEYDGTGALIQEIVWLGDIPLATLRLEACGFSIFYIHTDHLNTPRRITRRSTQDVVWSWESDPFGSSAPNENPSGLGAFSYNPRFPGQYYDQETALNYNIARDYEPATGRYIESDPVGLFSGINTYAYVSDNPLSQIDPNGLFSLNVTTSSSVVEHVPGNAWYGWIPFFGGNAIGLTQISVPAARCTCNGCGGSWQLTECSAMLDIKVSIQSGLNFWANYFANRSEGEHVTDMSAGIDRVRRVGAAAEIRQQRQLYSTKSECEKQASLVVTAAVRASARAVAYGSGERDRNGSHHYPGVWPF